MRGVWCEVMFEGVWGGLENGIGFLEIGVGAFDWGLVRVWLGGVIEEK